MLGAPPASPAQVDKTIFYSLDGIRGVAALLVVMRHTQRLFSPWTFQESYLAVDVFFVLSGVVIAQAYGRRLLEGTMPLAQFAWIRLVRIMPLYLLGTAISVGAACAGLMNFGSLKLTVLYVVLALFMLPNPGIGTIDVFPLNNPCWSLPLELVANGLYAALIRRLSNLRVGLVMVACALGIAFTVYADKSHSLNIGFWAHSFPFGFFRVGYSFFAGVLLFKAFPFLTVTFGKVPMQSTVAWSVLGATALLLTASPRPAVQPFFDFFSVVGVFPLIVTIGMLVQPSGIAATVFRFLGLISYAVYTLHAPLVGLLDGLSHWRLAAYAPESGLAFLLLIVPCSAYADRLYDFPVRRRLLRLTRRVKA